MIHDVNVARREPPSHTFLLRIWIEDMPEESGKLVWRGSIAYLPADDRGYVQSFDDIADFIRRHVGWPEHVGGFPEPGSGR